MRREVKQLRIWLGRVIRDAQRKAGELTGALKTRLETAQQLYEQQRDSKNKLYALHAPEVEYIAKGKAWTPYCVFRREDLGGGDGQARRGGGYALNAALTVRRAHTAQPARAGGDLHRGETQPGTADRGYRGVQAESVRLLLSHTRGLPRALKKLLKRSQAIEPTIGHMENDGLLARN